MSNEGENVWTVMMLLGAVIFGVSIGALYGISAGRDLIRQDAIKQGHAEWRADADGKAVFKWKGERP